MHKFKIAFISLVLVLGLGLMLQPVLAEDSNEESTEETTTAKAESKAESTCEAGPYGQCTTTAEAEAEVETTSKIVYLDGEVAGVTTHEPVDAALDMKTSAAAMGTIASGMIAFALKLKQRLS